MINSIYYFSRIYGYSTASTSEAAYIIGGVYTNSATANIVAEFKNDSWRQMGTLAKGRAWHGSIALENIVMVIGGYSDDDRLVYFHDYFLIINFFSVKETEIWNMTNGTNKVVNPTLPNWDYVAGIGLYIVPFNFCTT